MPMCSDNRGFKERDIDRSSQLAICMHLESTKMYQDLKQHFWWKIMTRDVTEFVSKCLVCQQTKAPRQKVVGLL